MTGSNYPPGVSEMDPHFDGPDVCPSCRAEGVTLGEDCPDCGEYVPTEDDYADEAADREFERRRMGDR